DDDDDDDDDDVSIVSRTPSPPPNAMDVDGQDISKYDEYVRGPAREVITVETKIKPTNKGFAMLAKLGWTEGTSLGLSADGRVDPVPFQMKSDSTGLGKVNQDVRMIESTVSQRRELDSERQHKESTEQRQARKDEVARREAVASEISDVLKPFYCSLCDKQFKNVAQYDEHTNSYSHHHKARAKDMQASARLKPQEEVDKRKQKERKREEKELRKIAAANGIKMSKTAPVTPATPSVSTALGASMSCEPSDSKSSGWATIPESEPISAQSGFKKSGWATVGSSDSQLPPSPPVPNKSNSMGGWNVVSSTEPSHTVETSRSSTMDTPAFRTGGWSTLDSAPSPQPAASQSSSSTPGGGWKTVSSVPVNSGIPSITAQDTPIKTSSSTSGRNTTSTSTPQDTLPSRPPSKAHVGRVGWQQFQKSNSRKK
ncbi:hypothetical protein K435DRAFT_645950, partial [Dendrothele bispora CBS 962.96]